MVLEERPPTGMYYDRPAEGSLILAVARGVCPPHGTISHTCDAAAGMLLWRFWLKEELLDSDGNCRACGERV